METIDKPIHKGAIGFVNDGSLLTEMISKDLVNSGSDILFQAANVHYGSQRMLLTNPLPEYVIFDVDFNDNEVLDLVAKLKMVYPKIRFIAHTSIDDIVLVDILLGIGFDGYLLWGSNTDDFKNAFKAIANGKKYLSAGIDHANLDYFQKYRNN